MALFKSGLFKLHSGETSRFKIDCDALLDEDIDSLALLAMEIVRPFGKVISVPTGGDRLANVLRRYESPNHRGHILIVDDVYTTGASMGKKYYELVNSSKTITGLVIFNRSKDEELDWIYSIFKLNHYKP